MNCERIYKISFYTGTATDAYLSRVHKTKEGAEQALLDKGFVYHPDMNEYYKGSPLNKDFVTAMISGTRLYD